MPRNRGKNPTLIASMALEGMGGTVAIEGATDSEAFEAYVERFLAPSLKGGQAVVIDSLPAHKSRRVRELIEERRAELRLLASCSPDLKWDEKAETTLRMGPTMVSAGES